jgi:hypothetical protein
MSNIHIGPLIETNDQGPQIKMPVCGPERKKKSDKSLYINFNWCC